MVLEVTLPLVLTGWGKKCHCTVSKILVPRVLSLIISSSSEKVVDSLPLSNSRRNYKFPSPGMHSALLLEPLSRLVLSTVSFCQCPCPIASVSFHGDVLHQMQVTPLIETNFTCRVWVRLANIHKCHCLFPW